MDWLGFKYYRGIFLKYYNHLHDCSITNACKIFFILRHAIDGQEALVIFV